MTFSLREAEAGKKVEEEWKKKHRERERERKKKERERRWKVEEEHKKGSGVTSTLDWNLKIPGSIPGSTLREIIHPKTTSSQLISFNN